MDRSRSSRASLRGFTLAEMLIAVAMVGVLATIAIASFKVYQTRAQVGEAKAMLGAIRNAETSMMAMSGEYLGCSASYTDYYPQDSAGPGETLWSFVNDGYGAKSDCWKRLHVTTDSPVRFAYIVMAGGPGEKPTPVPATTWADDAPIWPAAPADPWFVMLAVGDRDGDGTLAVVAGSSFQRSELHAKNEDE